MTGRWFILPAMRAVALAVVWAQRPPVIRVVYVPGPDGAR